MFYVGDGGNDLCPSLGLGSGDVVFPRKGYALEARVAKIRDAGKGRQGGQKLHEDGSSDQGQAQSLHSVTGPSYSEPQAQKVLTFSAEVVAWASGSEIQERLHRLVGSKEYD